ncbi:MAG TPA: MFS transporter [Mycobacteriales bacterium]|nr:MFS transporter [Mycobacteriales bacterium]
MRGERLATAATYAVLALTMADNTMVGVAVPRIRADFRAGVTSLEWVVAGYIVAFAGLLFTGGVLGDRYGRKRALLIGVGIFAAGAVIAALARNDTVLVAGRVVQGLGAACSEPGTLSLLRQLHPEERRRARVLGGWAAASGVALAAGPVAAGVLIAVGGWRAVFWGELVAAVLAGVIAAVLLGDSRDPAPGRDIAGQVCAAVTLASLVFALIDGQDRGFTSPVVVVAWVVGAAAAVAFVLVERSRPHGVVDLALVRDRSAAAGLWAAATSTFALFSVLLLVSLYVQVVGGYSGLGTAAVFTPMTLVMVVAGVIGGRWVVVRGARTTLVTGLSVAAAGMLALDLSLGRPVNAVATAGWLTLLGAGLGLVVAPMVGTVLARVPASRSGMAAAAATAAREVGGVVGVSVLGAILYAKLFSGLTHRLLDIGIPVSYRTIVIDAVRRGSKIPTNLVATDPAARHSVVGRVLASIKQSLIDRTVDAGKAAYVASVRDALIVAVGVLLAGAIGVWWLLRTTPDDP